MSLSQVEKIKLIVDDSKTALETPKNIIHFVKYGDFLYTKYKNNVVERKICSIEFGAEHLMFNTDYLVLPVCEQPGFPACPEHVQHVESAGESVQS